MGNDSSSTSSRWMMENILFLDSRGGGGDRGGRMKDEESSEDDEEVIARRQRNVSGRNCVKRFTPSHAKLRNRHFVIIFEIGGKNREFLLKMVNEPDCALILCDRGGEELRTIPTSKLLHIQRNNLKIDAYFSSAGQKANLSFSFQSKSDCSGFCESMRMLFGLQVRMYGEKTEMQESGAAGLGWEALHLLGGGEEEEDSSDDDDDDEAKEERRRAERK